MAKQVLILDSSQISTHYECAELWNLRYVENLTQFPAIDEPISAGTYGHKLLEIYYKNQFQGLAQAVKAALTYNIDEMDKADNGKFPLSPEKRKLVRARFQDYWMKYSAQDYTTLTKREHIIKVDEQGNPYDDYPNMPIVEKGFSYALLDSHEYLFVLEGKIDWIAQTPIGIAFVDHKFQFRERNLYSKSIQFKNYALASGMRLGVINYIRLKQNLDEKTLVRQPITFDAMEMTYWKQELTESFIAIAKEIKTGNHPRNWDSCAGKFGYECEFTRICNANPTMRPIMKGSFLKRKAWKPW